MVSYSSCFISAVNMSQEFFGPDNEASVSDLHPFYADPDPFYADPDPDPT